MIDPDDDPACLRVPDAEVGAATVVASRETVTNGGKPRRRLGVRRTSVDGHPARFCRPHAALARDGPIALPSSRHSASLLGRQGGAWAAEEDASLEVRADRRVASDAPRLGRPVEGVGLRRRPTDLRAQEFQG